MVRGVRWLGTSTRLVTFSSEKAGDGFRNSLLVTDVRSRASVPFREVRVLSTGCGHVLGLYISPKISPPLQTLSSEFESPHRHGIVCLHCRRES